MGNYADISHYHPVSDWDKVKKSSAFLISKATQGTSFVDSTLESFIKGCESNKIPYWLYTYLNKGDELAQAKYLVKTCKDKVGDYFRGYILDVEAGNTADNVKSALEYLEGLGGKVGLYTGWSNYDTYKSVISGRASTTFWWESRYGKDDGSYNSGYPCHDGVDLHQFTSNGTCDGISGKCDLNRLTGAKKESWFTDVTSGSKDNSDTETPSGTTLELVYQTMLGTYGNGDARKTALGSRYNEVMEVINHIASASVSTLVTETKAGNYGNGDTRKVVLGSRYDEVQAKINSSNSSASTVSYYSKYLGSSNSLVDALKAIGVDSSKTNRTKIAKANGISDYTGTEAQNTKLLNLLKSGKLKKA